MGFFKKLQAKSAYASALNQYQGALAQWEDEKTHVEGILDWAVNLEREARKNESRYSVRLKPGERIVAGMEGASSLVEPRSSGGSYQGGSRGASIRVAKGVSFRVGAHKGTYVPGPEVQKAIDTGGSLFITTQRVLYTSPGRNRDWLYDKAVDIFHSDNWNRDWGVTFIAVSNRQKTSGFAYPMKVARIVRDTLTIGLAAHDGMLDDLITGLREQQSELSGGRPIEPSPPPELSS